MILKTDKDQNGLCALPLIFILFLFQLKECDTEYNEIKKYFLESLGSSRIVQIKSIERIENGDLWENFVR